MIGRRLLRALLRAPSALIGATTPGRTLRDALA